MGRRGGGAGGSELRGRATALAALAALTALTAALAALAALAVLAVLASLVALAALAAALSTLAALAALAALATLAATISAAVFIGCHRQQWRQMGLRGGLVARLRRPRHAHHGWSTL